MSIEDTQFNKALQSFKRAGLSVSAKQDMKESILSHGTQQASVPSGEASLRGGKKLVAGLGIAFIGFAGVAFASAESLPNEFLYPIKTSIVEPAVGLTQLSIHAKQEYQIKLAQERIEEYQLLESEGEMSIKIQAELTQDVDQHLNQAESYGTEDEAEFAIQATREQLAELISSDDELPATPTQNSEQDERVPMFEAEEPFTLDVQENLEAPSQTETLEDGTTLDIQQQAEVDL